MNFDNLCRSPFATRLLTQRPEIAIVTELALKDEVHGIKAIGNVGAVLLWTVQDARAVGLTIAPAADMISWRDSVRTAIDLGVQRFLFISKAEPTPYLEDSDGIVVTDHINLTGRNPLVGKNDEHYGPRFPDVTAMYDKKVIGLICEKGRKLGFQLKPGLALAPVNPKQLSPLEQEVMAQNAVTALCGDVFGAALTACHAGKAVTTVLFFSNPAPEKLAAWLSAILNIFSAE